MTHCIVGEKGEEEKKTKKATKIADKTHPRKKNSLGV